MAAGEKLDDFVKLGGVVNDVITGNKLQEPTCYHIILYPRHNKLAEKHNKPLPPRLVMMTLSGSYTISYVCTPYASNVGDVPEYVYPFHICEAMSWLSHT